MRTRSRFSIPLLAMLTLAACDAGPIAWEETHAIGSDDSASARLVLVDGGAPRIAPLAAPTAPVPADACPGSVTYARLAGDEWHRAWWRAGETGTHLLAARSLDGGATWSAPVVVDTSDRARSGCNRLPPAIAADSITRYVHLVYYMRPPNGAGVWYAHSMDGGVTWHSQYGLIYGDDPARADVAVDGPVVAIAYELPNAAERKIGLSLSRDGGHNFLRPVMVSPTSAGAGQPSVAVRGKRVGVGWRGVNGGGYVRVGEVVED